MTSRERWLAAVEMKPVDRLPFWPKIGPAYLAAQASPFREMNVLELHEWIGSDRHEWVGTGIVERRRRTTVETSTNGNHHRTLWCGPGFQLEQVHQDDPVAGGGHPVKFPVTTREEIKLMTAIYEDVRVEVDVTAAAEAKQAARQIGEQASTAASIGESPLMYWLEYVAGIEQGHLLLMDYPDEVEALFAAMHRVLCDRARLMAEVCPADMMYMFENTSTTIISPEQYRGYCLGHITDYGKIMRAAGRRMILHMCGHLKQILQDVGRTPAHGFEAFTTPPVGNATLLDGRTLCPDKCLIGGTNATLWLKPAKAIIAAMERDFAALPHHRGLVVTSGGMMPPACTPDTIREVGAWVKSYRHKMNGSE